MSVINVPLNESGSYTRPALAYFPNDYNSTDDDYPLIVFLHGAGEGDGNLSSIYANSSAGGPSYFIHTGVWPASFTNPKNGMTYKFIVVSPQTNDSWSVTGPQLKWLLNHLVSTYRVNPDRIYLTGLSAGGQGINTYVIQNGVTPTYKAAAIVPMSAAHENPAANTGWAPIIVADSIRAWFFGDDPGDTFGTYAKTYATQMNNIKSGFARYTDYSGGHCCWNTFYNPTYKETVNGVNMNIYEWMLQFTRGEDEVPVNEPPAVFAGEDFDTEYTNEVALTGTVDDDGEYTSLWSMVTYGKAQPGGTAYTVTPAGNTRYELNSQGSYLPGDTIFLSGYFKSVNLQNLSGAPGNYIVITNKPGETLVIGDSTWTGGGYAQSFTMRNCHYIEIKGTSKDNFKIVGSNEESARNAYLNLTATYFSSHIRIHNISFRHGGNAIYVKTDVVADNDQTWYPAKYMDSIEISNCDIYNTYNEAMYIGHTASYWNINTNAPYYPSGPSDVTASGNPTVYKRPIKLRYVHIFNNTVRSTGADGIQCAAIDSLYVYNNTVTDWANREDASHNGGILIGGRIKGFHVYNNIVRNGWGEFMQIYAEGGGAANVYNNIMSRNELDGVGMRGSLGLIVNFHNNTIAFPGSTGIRINGYYGQTSAQLISKNVIIDPGITNSYIYTENGASVTENDNRKFSTYAAAEVDSSDHYAYSGDASEGAGAIKQNFEGIVIVSPDELETLITGLFPGYYKFRLTADDGEHQDSSDVQFNVFAPEPDEEDPDPEPEEPIIRKYFTIPSGVKKVKFVNNNP